MRSNGRIKFERGRDNTSIKGLGIVYFPKNSTIVDNSTGFNSCLESTLLANEIGNEGTCSKRTEILGIKIKEKKLKKKEMIPAV